ncbi:MAG: GNAT family N-acetyltransferase [Thermoproteota archaeon]|nr:GNAT family N-acetyltransferase [Thermoproteota archaeon]
MWIRNAQSPDKDKVLSFCRDTFAWGDYIEEVWDKWLNDASGSLVVADSNSSESAIRNPVALCHASTCPHNSLWIEGIRVDRRYRNRGIASSLLHHVLQDGIQKGLEEACALVSFNNTPSRKLFEKHGFVAAGTFGYYNFNANKLMEIKGLDILNDPTSIDPFTNNLKLKYAKEQDYESILQYLVKSQTYSKSNGRYFNEWKLYKLHNTYSGIHEVASHKNIVLAVNGDNSIRGMSIINTIGHDPFYKGDLAQICYLDCMNSNDYNDFIISILKFLYHNVHSGNIQFFVDEHMDLTSISKDNNTDVLNPKEKFLIYYKKTS